MTSRSLLSRCAGLLAVALAAGCAGSGPNRAAGFDSAEKAVDALIAALRSDDQPKLHEILGEDLKPLANVTIEGLVADWKANA